MEKILALEENCVSTDVRNPGNTCVGALTAVMTLKVLNSYRNKHLLASSCSTVHF